MPKTKPSAMLPIGSAPWQAARCMERQCPLRTDMQDYEKRAVIRRCTAADGADTATATHAALIGECHRLNPIASAPAEP